MERLKLVNARKLKGLTQSEMAEKNAMEQTTYSRKERGKSPITDDEWNRFANTLEINVDDIKDVDEDTSSNVNCIFNDSSIGIQYVSIPQNVLDIIIKYNKILEEENKKLKDQINN